MDLRTPRRPARYRRTDRSPVVSGANRPRPKLANTGKQVLNLSNYNFTGLAGNEAIKMCAIEPGNMVSVAVDLLDTTVRLVRRSSLNSLPP